MVVEYLNLIVGIGLICAPFIMGVRISDDIVASRLGDNPHNSRS